MTKPENLQNYTTLNYNENVLQVPISKMSCAIHVLVTFDKPGGYVAFFPV